MSIGNGALLSNKIVVPYSFVGVMQSAWCVVYYCCSGDPALLYQANALSVEDRGVSGARLFIKVSSRPWLVIQALFLYLE